MGIFDFYYESIPTCVLILKFLFFKVYINMDVRLECAKVLAAGLATISLVGAGAGVGVVFGSLLVSFSRNPGLKNELFQYAILGFALTEAVGLLGIMMAFLLLFT